ncbi:hypothetical protein EV426DRAFT_699375 [Tirmania nivea]|nr:hypothetical protein EV426DRAFT_699375 [Tirmania nivea]
MALPAVEGDGTITVTDFLAQLRADPSGSGAGHSNQKGNGNGKNVSGSGSSRTTPSNFPPLSPRPPGSLPAGAFKVTTEITTTYVKDLHELIQRITPGNGPKCIQAIFDAQSSLDNEGRELPSFWAKLKISGVEGQEGAEWVDQGPFASKKLAKEAVARRGGEWLRDVVKGWGRQGGKMGGGAKGGVLIPGTVAGEVGGDVQIVEGEEEERLLNGEWVGTLNTYIQRRRLKPPTYTFYSTLTASAFSCTVAIPELTGHSVSIPLPNANPTEFGSSKIFYRKKTTARSAAARDAVLWVWSVDPAAKNAALLSPGTRHLATLPGSSLTASYSSSAPEIHIPPELKEARAPQLVGWLCPKLSLCPLEYMFESPDNVPNLVNARGRVKRVKPGVAVDQFVDLGPVENVFGKPTAKARIAELCLYWMCRRESVRLGVKIVGLREEFYAEDEDDMMSIDGVEEGRAEIASIRDASESANVSKGYPAIKQEGISDEEDDMMSLA